MKKLFLVCLFFAGLICSCSNESPIDTRPITADSNSLIPEKGILSFYYNGTYYSSEYQMIDTVVVFTDSKVDELSRKFKSLPNVATYYREDGCIEYFDTPESLQTKLNLHEYTNDKLSSVITRGYAGGVLNVYEHCDYGGRTLSFSSPCQIPELRNVHPIPLQRAEFNDIISSIELKYASSSNLYANYCVATFFRDEDYNGYSFWIRVSNTLKRNCISNLRSLPLYPGSSRNFNDRISSITMVNVER